MKFSPKPQLDVTKCPKPGNIAKCHTLYHQFMQQISSLPDEKKKVTLIALE
jgi:hypothetical protein